MFTDEARFKREVAVNFHNIHVWADKNPSHYVSFEISTSIFDQSLFGLLGGSALQGQ
jgi:hypothetical protein